MGTTGQSITLANSIIGVGILAMPFCFQQCGVLLATVILLSMGLVSRLCCYYLLKSALIARRRNFEFLAFHVFGPAGKLAVEVGIIGFLMGTCIAYFVVVGDLGPQIIAKMFNINQSDILRTSIMVIVSLVCVLPLGLLRNVDSLSNVSAATICFYFILVMKVIVEATSQVWDGDWQSRVETWKPSGVLQCVPIFSMALFCQTQLFEIFESLPTLSLEKMNLVTKNAINICTGVYFTLGLFGYIAFSAQDISGNILMSLSPTMASDVIKLGFVMSVAFSFPLIIFPCRASLYSLLYKKVHSSHHDHIINHSIPERPFRCLTVCIVAAALGVSLLLPNIELVLGLVGSTIGVLVCVVFPAACFLNLTFKNTNERVLAKGILILGLIIMVLGTYANLQAAENQIDKYDEKYITKERIDKIVEDFFEKREKADGVMAKPDIRSNKHVDENKIDTNIVKESVVLPPNPVPPESQSNEKIKINEQDIPQKLKQVPEPLNDIIDKVSETHPKNLNKLNEAKTTNGQKKENVQESPKEENKPQSNEEKINLRKQQQLIETIKQHGEEQKELIKEQKEILTEIKKTKEELQKSKKETAEADAKKIAVESIKKIANVAIQSLAGVSDKPGQIGDDKLEKLADEAVQQIVQKAAETLEAMKENKEVPKESGNLPPPVQLNAVNPSQNNMQMNQNAANVQQNNVPTNVQTNENVNKLQGSQNVANVPSPVGNVPPPVNVAQSQKNIVQPSPNVPQAVQNAPSILNVAQPIQNAVNSPPNAPSVQNLPDPPAYVQPVANNVQSVENAPLTSNNAQLANIQQVPLNQNSNNVHNSPNNKASNQPHQNEFVNSNVPAQYNVNPIQHLHSPDEPQSYKIGEETNNIDQSLNKAAQKLHIPQKSAANNNQQNGDKSLSNNLVQNNGAQIDQNKIENTHGIRQKREVVDCTEKSSLKPEDKEICKTLVDDPGLNIDVKDILASKVDLSDIALPKDIAIQQNVIHHLSRTLKTYEDLTNSER